MKSKLLLGALLMGAVVLPSCVDDTVSSEVVAIRQAKAKQLESLAALNNANAAAATTLANANAALLQAQADEAKANAQVAAANAALIAAQTETEKTNAMVAAEKAQLQLAEIKNQMALLEGQQKLAELQQQQDILKAQQDLAAAILQGEADKAEALLNYLDEYVDSNKQLAQARKDLYTAQVALTNAQNDTAPELGVLQKNVIQANNAVATAEATVAKKQAELIKLQEDNGNVAAAQANLATAKNQAAEAQKAYEGAAAADATIAKTTNDAVKALANSNYEVAVNNMVAAANDVVSKIGMALSVASADVAIEVKDVPSLGDQSYNLVQNLTVKIPGLVDANKKQITTTLLAGKTTQVDSTVVLVEGQPASKMSYNTYTLANANTAGINQTIDSIQSYINAHQGATAADAQKNMAAVEAYAAVLNNNVVTAKAAVAAQQAAVNAAQAVVDAATAAGQTPTDAQKQALADAQSALATAQTNLTTANDTYEDYIAGADYTNVANQLKAANEAVTAANKVLAAFKSAAETVASQSAANTSMVNAINAGLTSKFTTDVTKFIAKSNLDIANAEVAAYTAIIAAGGNAGDLIDAKAVELKTAKDNLDLAKNAQANAQKALDAYKGESEQGKSDYAVVVAQLTEQVQAATLKVQALEKQTAAYKALFENAINAQ